MLPSQLDVVDVMALWQETSLFNEESRITDKHKQMIRNITICTIGGIGPVRYVLWRLRHKDFWHAAGLTKKHLPFAMRRPLASNKPVFVDIRQGGPLNQVFSQLVEDKRRLLGLLIQMHGFPNEVPCQCCVRRFSEFETEVHAGMWPFFGCRSLPGVSGESCGVCVFLVKAEKCEFRDERFANLHARADRNPPIVEDLTLDNSPVLIFFIVTQKAGRISPNSTIRLPNKSASDVLAAVFSNPSPMSEHPKNLYFNSSEPKEMSVEAKDAEKRAQV
ncbi:hypothetical protein GGR52DRAFT_590500 [Hypoxylon sp. FL1284]|nr:hypothetical protein GGR52DRAFT_590500 [Hypoxylon sp. FL1284]